MVQISEDFLIVLIKGNPFFVMGDESSGGCKVEVFLLTY